MVNHAPFLPSRLRPPPPLGPFSTGRFKGVRQRSWGRWVSEIRIPHSREKIWLGSYASAQQAARAYDIASILLRGSSCTAFLNFPDSTSLITNNQQLAALAAGGTASPRTIQATAAAAAANCIVPAAGRATRDIDHTMNNNCQKPEDILVIMDTHDNIDANERCKTSLIRDRLDMDRNVCTGSPSLPGASSSACSPKSCWIQDVIGLIISPKAEKAPSLSSLSSSSSMLQDSSCRLCGNGNSATHGPSSLSNTLCPSISCCKARIPDCLIQMLILEDFQCPLEGTLARDGFTAASVAVTTCKRFDTPQTTTGPSCEIDATQLWSYVC